MTCWQAYNPEEDEGEDVKVVHPKTDEQRTRLQERVQSQLLFRTLDQDQLIEVDITAANKKGSVSRNPPKVLDLIENTLDQQNVLYHLRV